MIMDYIIRQHTGIAIRSKVAALFFLNVLALALMAASAQAASLAGEYSSFPQPNGVIEQCIRINPLPGAHYSRHDLKAEAEYCKLDLRQLALCPKLWSTSPGTILYQVDVSKYGGSFEAFEKQQCAEGHHARSAALGKAASFKMSVNARDTSATYAPSSWIYYHLSRYFDARIHVPVAVYRSMDSAEHNRRVVKPAIAITAGRHNLRMLSAGWHFLDQVENGQAEGSTASAVLTDDGRQVFGVLLDAKGDRYSAEINGTRESGWGAGQNLDFQQTAPYIALRDPSPVAEAAKAGIHEARKNPRMAKDLSANIPVEQVVFWMQDVLEITLLDYMLGQQDRIGNIDYIWRWYWLQDGKLESEDAHGSEAPSEIAVFNPVRLKQTALNDNDAGVRAGYADFAAKTHMLEGLRHYSPGLYTRLGRLAADLGNQGPIYQWMTQAAGLSSKEADTIASRAISAFEILKADCEKGDLVLDLDPVAHLAQSQGADYTPSAGVQTGCTVTYP